MSSHTRTMVRRLVGVCLLAATSATASATFHLVHIEQVVAGLNGDVSAQAVQLVMRSGDQNLLEPARLVVRDAAGENPIVLFDFEGDIAEEGEGVRILVGTAELDRYADEGVGTDYTLTATIPPSYFAAGSLTFESDDGTRVVSRLSWGGGGYTGATDGIPDNTTGSDFAPPFPAALTSAGVRALLFQPEAGDRATGNADDYQFVEVVELRNNAGEGFVLGPCVSAEDQDGDGLCDVADPCPQVAGDGADRDGDGRGDACDACPDDPAKLAAGLCGCGQAETDSNGDGTPDCGDPAGAVPCAAPVVALTLPLLLMRRRGR